MKQEQIILIKQEIAEKWKATNGLVGVRRAKLENFSQEKKWKVRKVIAIMRKNKEIYLEKRYYFFNEKKKNGNL